MADGFRDETLVNLQRGGPVPFGHTLGSLVLNVFNRFHHINARHFSILVLITGIPFEIFSHLMSESHSAFGSASAFKKLVISP